MKLIDRYVTEVGKYLLLVKNRKDIEKELQSTLEDMLEERAQSQGKPTDETLELELLKEYGSPAKVAETYNPNPYLIGPRIFPIFMTILKIVIAAVSLGFSIVTIIELVSIYPITSQEIIKSIGQWIFNIVSASIAAFGHLALIFALIERYTPSADIKLDEEHEWDPTTLKQESEANEIKIWEPIIAIVFTFVAISIFNFNPQLIRFYYMEGHTWHSIPLLSEAFFRWLPLMNISWVAEILLNGLFLRTGKWTRPNRLFYIGTKLFSIFILAMLISGTSILAITSDSLQSAGVADLEALNIFDTFANQGMDLILGVAILGAVIDIIKNIKKLFSQE